MKILLCLALIWSGYFTVAHADDTNAPSTSPTMVMSLSVDGMSNNRTMTIAATNSPKEFANAAASNYQNFILSSTNIMPTNFVAALPMVAASMNTNLTSFLTTATAKEMDEAAGALKALKLQGRLPGMPQNRHATVTTGNFPASRLQAAAAYPFSITLHLVPAGDLFTNHYTMMRSSADAEWQLQKAWRTDTEGRTVVEWPVK